MIFFPLLPPISLIKLIYSFFTIQETPKDTCSSTAKSFRIRISRLVVLFDATTLLSFLSFFHSLALCVFMYSELRGYFKVATANVPVQQPRQNPFGGNFISLLTFQAFERWRFLALLSCVGNMFLLQVLVLLAILSNFPPPGRNG